MSTCMNELTKPDASGDEKDRTMIKHEREIEEGESSWNMEKEWRRIEW